MREIAAGDDVLIVLDAGRNRLGRDLLGLGDPSRLALLHGDLVESTTAFLETEVQHTHCVFKVEGAWDADEVDTMWELINGNEGNYFACVANYEVAWPWLAALTTLNSVWRHPDLCAA